MKSYIALFLCLLLLFGLAACGGTPAGSSGTDLTVSSDPDSETVSTEPPSQDSQEDSSSGAKDPVPNQVLVAERITKALYVLDFDLLRPGDPLEKGVVWTRSDLPAASIAGMKYREDTVFGDVIVFAGTVSGILSYPEGELLWTTDNPGLNPHSVEILPSGNIVIANSDGGTLRLFYSSAALEGDTATAKKFVETSLKGAHGVLWDPEYQVLWALGDEELKAYMVSGEGASQKLIPIGEMGGTLPAKRTGGHDLSADYTDTRYLYMTTNGGALKFDKEKNSFLINFSQSDKLNAGTYMKALSNNPNNNFFYAQSNFGKGTPWENESFASWSTDRIHYCYWKTDKVMEVQEYISSEGAAIYKCRAFCGSYQ